MIREFFLIGFLTLPCLAFADGPDAGAPANPELAKTLVTNTLERYRTPFEALNERKIGESSRAVRFDWRKKTVGFGLIGSQLLEFNNFGSARFGGFLRKPMGPLTIELAVSWVFAWGSASADALALTPYRQLGRPARLEIDINLAYPVAEGVATALPGFFPATEFVFSINAGLRYLIYPGAMDNMDAGYAFTQLFAFRLSQQEFDNLETKRLAILPWMFCDPLFPRRPHAAARSMLHSTRNNERTTRGLARIFPRYRRKPRRSMILR